MIFCAQFARFRGGVDFEEDTNLDRPIFRGPEGTVRFDPMELKRISVEIVRRNLLPPESQVINRAIVNPEDITPVRRPGESVTASNNAHSDTYLPLIVFL